MYLKYPETIRERGDCDGKNKKDVEGGLGIHARRAIAYIVLIIISFSVCSGFILCLSTPPVLRGVESRVYSTPK